MKIIDFILKYNLQDKIELYPSNSNTMWRGEFKNVKLDFKKSVPHIMLDKNKNVIEFFVMDNLIRSTDKFFTNLPVSAKFYEDGNYKEVTDYVFENSNFYLLTRKYDKNGILIGKTYYITHNGYKFESNYDGASNLFFDGENAVISFKKYNEYDFERKNKYSKIVIKDKKVLELVYNKDDGTTEYIELDKNGNLVSYLLTNKEKEKLFSIKLEIIYPDKSSDYYGYTLKHFNDNMICSDKGAAIATYDLDNKIISERYILKDKFENEIDELELSVLKGLERSKNINIKEIINKILESHKIDVDSVFKNINDLLTAK